MTRDPTADPAPAWLARTSSTVGEKAATWGYRKDGVPGAIDTGAAGAVGYVAVRRVVGRAVTADRGSNEGSSGGGSTDDERSETTE